MASKARWRRSPRHPGIDLPSVWLTLKLASASPRWLEPFFCATMREDPIHRPPGSQDAACAFGFPPQTPTTHRSLTIYLIAAVPILIKLLCYPSYPGSDDAFIHLTIVRNLTHGLGWGINPGEPINVSSSPLYTALVSLLSLSGMRALYAGEFLSALSGFFGLVFLHRLLGRLGLRRQRVWPVQSSQPSTSIYGGGTG
jgi:hypothetical protein